MNYILNWHFTKIHQAYFLSVREHNFTQESKNIRTLILGDSHVLRAIDPHLIRDSYNYSSHAENYVHIYFRLKKYLSNNSLPKLSTAILQMDPHCFTKKFNEQQYLAFMKDYIEPCELGTSISTKLYYTVYYRLLANSAKYLGGLRIILDSLFWQYSDTSDYKGYEPLSYNQVQNLKTLHETIDYHFKYSEIFPIMKLYFEKIITLLEAHKIRVVLLSYPMTKAYRVLAPQQYIKDFVKYKHQVLSQDDNLIMLNYHNMFFNENKPVGEFFADYNHLNQKGSEQVSKRLKQDLDLLLP